MYIKSESINVKQHSKIFVKKSIRSGEEGKVNKIKKLEKIEESTFEIPKFNEYLFLKQKNYRISFLKEICRAYKIKVSGSKPILIERIYDHLFLSTYAIIIQKNVRRFLRYKFNNLYGPAIFERNKCKNDRDFLTFENVEEIKYGNFVSYKDNVGNVWGYNIKTLYNLFLKNKNNIPTLCPYTRETIDNKIFRNIKQIIRINKIYKENIDLSLNDETEILTQKKKMELRCLELFQLIDNLGNYTDIKWYLTLNRPNLVKFIRELMDIWEYRALLSESIKREICYPEGRPFKYINVTILNEISFNSLQKMGLTLIEQFIKTAINRGSAALGASYVLCALTLVNNDAANALPWLYESVANIE